MMKIIVTFLNTPERVPPLKKGEKRDCEELGSLEAVVLNYDSQDNALFIRRVRDHVRRLEKDALYVGRFNYLFSGRLYFMGYFSLEKIK